MGCFVLGVASGMVILVGVVMLYAFLQSDDDTDYWDDYWGDD